MYSPERSPSAIITAALENKSFRGYYVFVEGGGDFRLWRNFLLKTLTKVTICNGCDKVIKATTLGNEKGIRCFGIIDRDFRNILGSEELPDNVFITDEHDIELMISRSASLEKVLNNYDSSQKIDDYELAHGSVRECVLALTDQIGYLKLLHKRIDLNIDLKKIDKDGNIELPSYERFLNQHCQIKSIRDMIQYLLQWSESHGKKANKTVDDVVDAYQTESVNTHDSWQLSNGHDFAYLLSYFVYKEIGCKKKTRQEIEGDLILSYEHEYFKQTAMCREMYNWIMANNNNETLFSFNLS